MSVLDENPFAGRRTRILGMQDVRRLLDMREAIEIQRQAFIAHATARTIVAENSWLRLPGDRRGWLKLLAGYDDATAALGVKILARFPENPSGANLGSVILLFDRDNGFPTAIMDGVYVTAVRTGAGAGLATEAFAAPEARNVGMVGTGVVAWHSLVAMVLARPGLSSITVFSRSSSRRETFAGRIRDELGIRSTAVDTVAAAVRDADVIVTATNSPEPILDAAHIVPGQLVNAMGIRTEVAPDVLRRCTVVADGRTEALHEGKFSVGVAAGAVTVADLGPELGQVLADPSVLGHRPEHVVLFDSSGVAIQDVDAAHLVLERAERENAGVLVDLGLGQSP